MINVTAYFIEIQFLLKMKESNITVTPVGQETRYNISININDISGINPTYYNPDYVIEIYYADQTATLSRDSEAEILKLYFKILQCIQKANKNKPCKDFLVIYNNDPYLLSELNITES